MDVAQWAQQHAEEARAALARRRAELDEASRILDVATQAREGHRAREAATTRTPSSVSWPSLEAAKRAGAAPKKAVWQ